MSFEEEPKVATVRFEGASSIWTTARSVVWSAPTTLPRYTRPSDSVIVIVAEDESAPVDWDEEVASEMTW